MKRIYLAGPMTGIENLNFDVFRAAAAALRAQGHEVVSPTELVMDKTTPWREAMRIAIGGMMTCDTVVLLPGWGQSRGATIERELAFRLGFTVVVLDSIGEI